MNKHKSFVNGYELEIIGHKRFYLSSNEEDMHHAWAIDFNDGTQEDLYKNGSYNIRPIRSQ